MTLKEKEALLQELADLREIYNVYWNKKFEGGFTKRQRMKNIRKVYAIGRRFNQIHSLVMSLSIDKDTSTPK